MIRAVKGGERLGGKPVVVFMGVFLNGFCLAWYLDPWALLGAQVVLASAGGFDEVLSIVCQGTVGTIKERGGPLWCMS